MTRGKWLAILAVASLAIGLMLMPAGLSHAPGTRTGMAGWAGLALLVCSAAASLGATILTRRDARDLVRRLRAMADDRKLAPLPLEGELADVAAAINAVSTAAAAAVSAAALQAKELEIRLKVADAERQHAQAIIYSISDAVLVTDPFDDLVLANDSAARTFAFDLAAARRHPIAEVLRDATLLDLIREVRRGAGGVRVVEHRVQTGGEERVYKVTLSRVADHAEQPVGVVAVLHDMTREREVAELKSDFVSSVSHELRTPLASIKAYVEMLIDGEAADDEKIERDFYEVIQNEANRLSRLIDNILNVSRIESGLVPVNKVPQSLMVILKEAIEVIAPQARAKRIEIVEQLTPAFYQTPADKDMLYQAVLNLLSNAVKYTPDGGTVTVRTEVDEGRRRVVTSIADTGVGIPPKDLPFVFDKFYRVEANNHMAKGTGLGLSLVRHIVETVHRGRVFVESRPGRGSTFGFELDLCD